MYHQKRVDIGLISVRICWYSTLKYRYHIGTDAFQSSISLDFISGSFQMHLWWLATMRRCSRPSHRRMLKLFPPLHLKLLSLPHLVDTKQHVWGAETRCLPPQLIKVVHSLCGFSSFSPGLSQCPCLQRIQRRTRRPRRNPSGRNAKFDALLLFRGPIVGQSGTHSQPSTICVDQSQNTHWLLAVSVEQPCWWFCVFLYVCWLRHFLFPGTT